MRLMIFVYAFGGIAFLAGCGMSSTESKSVEVAQHSQPSQSGSNNPDLISTDGELFPLSTVFGVCVRYKGIWKADLNNGMTGPHYPTYADVTLAGGIKLKITVGKFSMWPGTVFKEVPAASPPRRIRVATFKGEETLLVSDFEGAGNNLVGIGNDDVDPKIEAEILRFANSVVTCHVSAAAAGPKGK